MKRKIYTTPEGVRVQGTLERAYGVAAAYGPDDEGFPKYEGSTEFNYDSDTVLGDDGERVWVCEDGCEWSEADLVIEEVDE